MLEVECVRSDNWLRNVIPTLWRHFNREAEAGFVKQLAVAFRALFIDTHWQWWGRW